MTTYTILLRRDVAADWTSANPTLANGELGVETDTGKLKIGDGATAWADLDYFAGEVGDIAASDVTSGTFADARIAESNVTQHEAALTVTEAQISDLGAYATAAALTAHENDSANPHSVTAAQADALPEDAGIVSVTEAHTLLAGNAGKVHLCDGTFTITLPDGLNTGYQVSIINTGSGTITLAAETTLNSVGSAVTLATQYEMAVAVHVGSGVWIAGGGLE